MKITTDLLQRATGCGGSVALMWAEPLAAACERYEVNTPSRIAAFLAQVGHESAGFTRTTENLNYSAKGLLATWPSRFSETSALLYARQPEKIANHVYGRRLGNKEPGDGWRYRGRGLVQVTGRANYGAVRDLLRESMQNVPDLLLRPQALTELKWAALSAAAYWSDHNLNALADAGQFADITRRINGGTIGAADRNARYMKAMAAVLV